MTMGAFKFVPESVVNLNCCNSQEHRKLLRGRLQAGAGRFQGPVLGDRMYGATPSPSWGDVDGEEKKADMMRPNQILADLFITPSLSTYSRPRT
jgi:hypothetical protein